MICTHFSASPRVGKYPMCKYRCGLLPPPASGERLMKNLNRASCGFCEGRIEMGASRRQRVSMNALTPALACGLAACFVVGAIALPGPHGVGARDTSRAKRISHD